MELYDELFEALDRVNDLNRREGRDKYRATGAPEDPEKWAVRLLRDIVADGASRPPGSRRLQ